MIQSLLIGIVKGYRLLLSPWLGSACRFEPTCSAYALQVLSTHGAVRGSGLTVWRLVRCHPWCDGGLDLPPPARHSSAPDTPPGLFTGLIGRQTPQPLPKKPS
ncbi:MAG: membrane protein insertion efficiency factor YidD [Burkholderiales bacterium]|nr:membrane protein insertion efficiency factor YidD [Burkholderiales bacterium]